MRLAAHSILCAAGCTLPVIFLGGHPAIMITNMIVVISACLTFRMCVHGEKP